MTQASIRPVMAEDAHAIASIYNHYVLNSIATFEEQPVVAETMATRMHHTALARMPWLVAVDGETLLGYAYAGPWKARSAYRHSAEITVYVAPEATGQGVGTRLYEALFAILRDTSIRIVIGGVSLPNAASIALHEHFGMRKVAHFHEVGFKFNRWIDVGYWQMALGAEPA